MSIVHDTAEGIETRLTGSRLVHVKSQYSNTPGMHAWGFNTIIIIELYVNKKYTYQKYTQRFHNANKKSKNNIDEIYLTGYWTIKTEDGTSPVLLLSGKNDEKKAFSLKFNSDTDLWLEHEKYVRMSICGNEFAHGKGLQ